MVAHPTWDPRGSGTRASACSKPAGGTFLAGTMDEEGASRMGADMREDGSTSTAALLIWERRHSMIHKSRACFMSGPSLIIRPNRDLRTLRGPLVPVDGTDA